MGKKEFKLRGEALVNRMALIFIEIISAALIFGYVADYFAGNASLGYFVAFEVAAITNAVLVLAVYFNKPEKLKNISFISFSVVYAIALCRPSVDLAFVMAFPIVIVFVLYYDYSLICKMTNTFMLITILDCANVLFIKKQHHSGLPLNSSILLMEFLGTGVFMSGATIVTKITKQNNDEKIAKIEEAAEKVNNSIKTINEEIVILNESSAAAKMAMEEINSGITSTAEAVQNQLMQTEAIQNRIENVDIAAKKIDENVDATMSYVAEGTEGVNVLVSQADKSVEISDRVIEDLNLLKKSVGDLGGITKMIENIAFQTNIMALNANVEAARAGEAGKGFAVVATEISNMSAKTKEATDDIESIISNAEDSLDGLVKSVTQMAEVIISEKEQTEQTSELFNNIHNTTEEVRDNMKLFMDYIAGLTQANMEIVQSVSTISATTEEVTALSAEAMSKENANADSVSTIAEQIGELAK